MEKKIYFEDLKKQLDKGKLIIYPTDTVYGIGGSLYNIEALKNIYKAKERDFSSPIILLISDLDKIEEVAIIPEFNREKVKKLIDNFFPGALTIILNKKNIVPDIITANTDTVGIRMPDLKLALDIIKSSGGVLPTTSANISGEKTPTSYDELSEKIKNRSDIIINGGKALIGKESTIIDMTNTPKILRVGAISIEEIEKLIGKIEK